MEKKRTNNNINSSKICKICNRCFTSGKAIGGHMRSHFAKLPIPPKPILRTPLDDHEPSEISMVGVDGGSSSTQQPPLPPSSHTIQTKKNSPAIQNFRSLNQDFAAIVADSNEDQESESDQSYPTGKRSKRCRNIDDTTKAMKLSLKTKADEGEPKQTSLMFDSLSLVIEAARSLIVLSKDKWPEGKEMIKKKQVMNEDEKEDSYVGIHFQGGKYECEMCNKVFGSYQALGGHKANHKRFIKNDQLKEDGEFDEENGDDSIRVTKKDILEDPKVLKCPFCFKVFESGQGLGRHKKVHFPNSMKSRVRCIDLNIPAPVEDIEEDSQIQSSTVPAKIIE